MRLLETRLGSRPVRRAAAAGVISLGLLAQACGSATAHSTIGAAGGTTVRSGSTASRATAGGLGSRFFGMHIPDFTTTYPTALGSSVGAVNLTTDSVYWPDLEASQGTWTLDRLTALVDQAHSHGAQPMLVLGQTPAWASSDATVTPASASVPQLAAWRAYVQKIVSTYGARLDYEIWPEPNVTQNWRGTPGQLATLVSSASTIIHSVAPKALVVSPAMTLRMKAQRTFMDQFFASVVGGKGVGRYVDAVGLDAYPATSGAPEDSLALERKARKILASHRVTAPVWNVEINYGVLGKGQTVSTQPTATTQASYVVRTYVLNAAAGVRRVYWLGWGSYPTLGVSTAGADGTPTKAGTAFLTVASWLRGRTAGPCTLDQTHHLYTCRLMQAGRASWVYWTTRGSTVIRVPKGSRHWSTMTGTTKATSRGKRLTVTSSPIWVHP